jgi:hypothetical protein
MSIPVNTDHRIDQLKFRCILVVFMSYSALKITYIEAHSLLNKYLNYALINSLIYVPTND